VAEHGQAAVIALARRAARAGRSFVAGLRDVLEVHAARALKQVAARRGQVAQLVGGTGQECLRQRRVAPPDHGVGSQVVVAHARSDAHAGVGQLLDPVGDDAPDVDEDVRPLDVQLHKVDQVGAAGQEGGLRLAGQQVDRSACVGRQFVAERPHG
jgi:hypothetical protein